MLNHLADSDGDPPAVLMGDFNQWGDRSGAMQEFEGPWHVCQTGPTFPTRRPIDQRDTKKAAAAGCRRPESVYRDVLYMYLNSVTMSIRKTK